MLDGCWEDGSGSGLLRGDWVERPRGLFLLLLEASHGNRDRDTRTVETPVLFVRRPELHNVSFAPRFWLFLLTFVCACISYSLVSSCLPVSLVSSCIRARPIPSVGYQEQGQAGRADGYVPVDVRRVRGGDQGDLPDNPRQRRPGERPVAAVATQPHSKWPASGAHTAAFCPCGACSPSTPTFSSRSLFLL